MDVRDLEIDRLALVGDIGRTSVRLGLADETGRLLRDTVRTYDISLGASIPHLIGVFAGEAKIRSLPSRCAIAISGVPRGEVIQVTNSRLVLSREELAGLIGAPPLILNDFAANAWAIGSEVCASRVQSLNGPIPKPYEPGAYCIIGVGSGLGVALLTRDRYGVVNVIPTEAGHMGFMSDMKGSEAVIEHIGSVRGYVSGEALLSRSGLVSTYQALARIRGTDVLCVPDLFCHDIAKHDRLAAETHECFVSALWHFAGNMVLAYGAWDGVILTGSVVAALRGAIRRPDLAQAFLIGGPYMERLREVPRSTVSFEFAELEGAAAALIHDERRRAAGRDTNTSTVVDHPTRRKGRRNGSDHLSAVPNLPV